MRKVFRIMVSLILTITICSSSFNVIPVEGAEKPQDSKLYSLSCALIDGDTGRVLYEKNGYEQRAMASTTKIMTLILALEYGNMDDMVTVSSYAAKMPDVQLGICEGEQYKLGDLVYSMMLESHNDSAVAIAEHVGGNVEKFAIMMNQKAAELNLSSTYFITPNGLDAEDKTGKHSTTAVELAQIMRYCVMDSPEREAFIEICQTRNHSFSDYSGSRSFTVTNHNKFLDMAEGVIAGKTGFTADAGYCYVTAVERNGKTYIIALLGCGWPNNKNYKWEDTKKLLSYGTDNYEYETVIDESWSTENIPVIKGIEKENIPVSIRDSVCLILSQDDIVEICPDIPAVIEAPVKEGDIVGSIDIYINDLLYTSLNVYSDEDVKRINFGYYLDIVVEDFLH